MAELVGEVRLSDEPASDAGAGLLNQLHISGEPAVDLESVGSTDPMLVDSDTALLDAFPTNVVVYDEPLPHAESDGSTITEVLVISHDEFPDEGVPTRSARRCKT